MKWLGVITLLVLSLLAQSEDITDHPRAINSDTLKISDERIRLHGMDAPESYQTREWPGIVIR